MPLDYDAWLEHPYQERARHADEFDSVCAVLEIDPSDPDAPQHVADYLEAAADEAGGRLAEARAEREPSWLY